MKKTLLESLVDYDRVTLEALAETRGAVVTNQQPLAAARELAPQLLAPASVAIAVADLAPAEREALAALQANSGWLESPRFIRRFGDVRPMGPARLARERPWQAPANATEALWYRGLVFRGFRPAADGVVEVFYVPDDLLALLPPPPDDTVQPTLAALDVPPQTWHDAADLVEDVFNLLVALRRRPLAVDASGNLAEGDRRSLTAQWVRPLPAAEAATDDRLDWLLSLCSAAGLTTRQGTRLAVNREDTRTWLETPPRQRHRRLLEAWREDEAWNDLSHVPTLKLRAATGWRNDPRLARQALLRALSPCRPLTWYRLDDLVALIKANDPDFQRPDGDYSSWYVYSLDDQPLIGFEHWDAVEGALIRYLISGPLHWLGIVDLASGADKAASAFRMSATGAAILRGNDELESQSATRGRFIVREDFSVRVMADASLYDRFQLARFADRVGRDGEAIVYRIAPGGVNLIGKQGVNAAQISAFLMRVTGGQVPQRVLDALARWQRAGAARLERALVLHLDHPDLLQQLRRDAQIGPLLGETVGPASVLVPLTNEQRVRRWLTDHGYL
jgi:hypothetical protein